MQLATAVGAEIVSVDSMQVYRGMDIGTAKPSPDERRLVQHHLIDIVEPEDEFSVAEFQEAGRAVLDGGITRALIVGGSGLHYRSLVDPLEFPPADEDVRAEIEALGPEGAVAALLRVDADAGSVMDLDNPRRVSRALEIHRAVPTEKGPRLLRG